MSCQRERRGKGIKDYGLRTWVVYDDVESVTTASRDQLCVDATGNNIIHSLCGGSSLVIARNIFHKTTTVSRFVKIG
jgi:hypothetical protein